MNIEIVLQRLANQLGTEQVNRMIAETNHAEALAEIERLRNQIAAMTPLKSVKKEKSHDSHAA
jgi:hypothetical protein